MESPLFVWGLLTGNEASGGVALGVASGCGLAEAGASDDGFMDGFMEELLWAAVFDLVFILDFRFLLIIGGYRQEGSEQFVPLLCIGPQTL